MTFSQFELRCDWNTSIWIVEDYSVFFFFCRLSRVLFFVDILAHNPLQIFWSGLVKLLAFPRLWKIESPVGTSIIIFNKLRIVSHLPAFIELPGGWKKHVTHFTSVFLLSVSSVCEWVYYYEFIPLFNEMQRRKIYRETYWKWVWTKTSRYFVVLLKVSCLDRMYVRKQAGILYFLMTNLLLY